MGTFLFIWSHLLRGGGGGMLGIIYEKHTRLYTGSVPSKSGEMAFLKALYVLGL